MRALVQSQGGVLSDKWKLLCFHLSSCAVSPRHSLSFEGKPVPRYFTHVSLASWVQSQRNSPTKIETNKAKQLIYSRVLLFDVQIFFDNIIGIAVMFSVRRRNNTRANSCIFSLNGKRQDRIQFNPLPSIHSNKQSVKNIKYLANLSYKQIEEQ